MYLKSFGAFTIRQDKNAKNKVEDCRTLVFSDRE